MLSGGDAEIHVEHPSSPEEHFPFNSAAVVTAGWLVSFATGRTITGSASLPHLRLPKKRKSKNSWSWKKKEKKRNKPRVFPPKVFFNVLKCSSRPRIKQSLGDEEEDVVVLHVRSPLVTRDHLFLHQYKDTRWFPVRDTCAPAVL